LDIALEDMAFMKRSDETSFGGYFWMRLCQTLRGYRAVNADDLRELLG
jgi:hypothetical protein